jgi:hypothetical protein
MKKKQLLPFISDERLFEQVKHVLDIARVSSVEAEKRLFTNTIDPFSALFDAMCQGISLKQWLEQEKARQTQKTLQNALGSFHQEILGSIPSWISLGTGSVFDLKNDSLKVIAEVKNKYNTTKGNHKVAIYDDLSDQLKTKYKGYVAYYVEIIPKNRAIYNKPFAPSDNRTHERRIAREDIRVIDGKSFYGFASGDPEAIKKFYDVLPIVINKLLGVNGSGDNYSYPSSDADIIKDAPRTPVRRNSLDATVGCDYAKLFNKVYW